MQKKVYFLTGLLLLGLLGTTSPVLAQDAPPAADKKEEASKKKKGKSYTEVITEEAITDEGFFTVHKVGSKYYFEVPTDVLEKEILVVSRIAGHVKGINFGGAGMKSRPQQVIRWQLKDNTVLLRSVSYVNVADDDQPIYNAVRNNNFEPVIMTFPMEVYNADSTAVVFEVSELFTSDVDMIGALSEGQKKSFGIRSLDKKRSFINHIKSFPSNVEVRHVLTYVGTQLPANSLTNTLSVEMNQSFILLPEKPMQPRLYDARVSYFSVRQTDYSLDEQKAAQRQYITRWRLEPKDPAAYARGELVEPIKPIVYYIDPATPEKWRPYLKKGITDWQSAFEKAGFKNAILAKDPPSKEEDPDWSPEDVRYSVIRYVATDIQNAQGPHVHDPRTGEILESDIIWYHNVMNLLRNWFLIQTAAVNPDAQKVKFSDELMGELIRFVAAHEVGHTLGLPHNMGSSVAYPVDSLRAPGFVQRMGVAPSIMDYARFNYVAQPEDVGAGLYPKIGPYDDWAIMFGYKRIPGVSDPVEDHRLVHEWILERADDPYYRFGFQDGIDPTAQTEDVGHNAMVASELGIKNLKRIVPELLNWTAEPGKDYSELEELYGQVLGQFNRYMGHVTTNVGGVYRYSKTSDQEGLVYTPVPQNLQSDAVRFLNKQLFMTPTWMIDNKILQRIESAGMVDRIRSTQVRTLRGLFRTDRLKRLVEGEALHGKNSYTLQQLFEDTRKGIWMELSSGATIDPYRRNLQRAYVDMMGDMVHQDSDDIAQSDIRAMARATLVELEDDISDSLKKQADASSKIHLKDILARLEALLDEDGD
ncbi:MAG: zinc-dependent metalloprotease [Saprospiraceae bacterium]|nr:zinc-dependent metalloprotease [Saprospiraceae bacterium]MDP4999456.1 zinc-dependent metalloprotease [Saprospiraceae bacterium]